MNTASIIAFSVLGTTLALPGSAHADTYTNITFDALTPGDELDGRLYLPDPMPAFPAAVIMMHGCSGLWSNSDPTAAVAQRHIEKWGMELAAQGYVALAVDGYTTRTPLAEATEAEYQHQCSGDPWAGDVDPYTTRVDDIEAAQEYLVDTYGVNTDGGLGLLGWSQGAQSVLVAMAATPRTSHVPYVDPPAYAAAVAFYPGCGAALGYGMSYSKNLPGYWRPANPMRLHHGSSDSLFGNCQTRALEAWNTYGTTPGTADELLWTPYTGVGHGFDHVGTTAFPTSKCDAAELANPALAAQCAMRDADIDSLAFFLAEVVEG